ncbi:hypothetical protein [Streptomyces hypolithicus]
MLVAAAVCPCPPLLVPEVAAGAAPELDAARAACADSLGVLAASRPDLLVVVGSAGPGEASTYPQGATGSFRGFGVDVTVRLDTFRAFPGTDGGSAPVSGTVVGQELPQSLAVGAWLLTREQWSGAPVEALGVAERTPADLCADQGRGLATRVERVALLVMGDASACRTLKAPGYLDERAEAFDARAAHALAAADPAALLALDAGLAYELKAAGRAPWQVLAGAAQGAGLGGQLLYEDAPYGVGYFVALWS